MYVNMSNSHSFVQFWAAVFTMWDKEYYFYFKHAVINKQDKNVYHINSDKQTFRSDSSNR